MFKRLFAYMASLKCEKTVDGLVLLDDLRLLNERAERLVRLYRERGYI